MGLLLSDFLIFSSGLASVIASGRCLNSGVFVNIDGCCGIFVVLLSLLFLLLSDVTESVFLLSLGVIILFLLSSLTSSVFFLAFFSSFESYNLFLSSFMPSDILNILARLYKVFFSMYIS